MLVSLHSLLKFHHQWLADHRATGGQQVMPMRLLTRAKSTVFVDHCSKSAYKQGAHTCVQR